DMGLALLKLGEEARVDLREFSLEGRNRKELRYAYRRSAKEGALFEVVPANQVNGIMEELRQVSDEWLKEKNTAEKGFSVGQFSEVYLSQFDCAVIRWEGRIVGFANIWMAPEGQEISVDLMRHRTSIPHGSMDFLFTHLMLWGKEQGYRWFNLGMAPLSGLQNHPLSSVWNQIGTFIFRHGEHFYNFEGLRTYKEKFDPGWTPKYLAAPGGLALPRMLFDVAALVSGGTKEIFHK
ncbi:MAG: phosphatidylglycerol lysyltransferase domain-containing protein, partial [Nitrospirales bacterium]